jgi:tetratricopeptide (TPR) repeat protein
MLTALLLLALAAESAPPLPDQAAAYHHFSLAQQHRLMGDADEAIEQFHRALLLDPGSAEIRAQLARQLRDRGRLEEARDEALRAVERDPDNLLAHEVLAQLYRLQVGAEGQDAIRMAAAELEEILRVQPGDRRTLDQVASYYAELGDHERAAGAWERFIELEPGAYDAYIRLGIHQRALGREADAQASFRRALELQPGSARAHAALGDSLVADAPDLAREQYEQVVALEPENLRVQLALAEVYAELGEHSLALERADVVLTEDPANRLALDRKGRALRDLRRFDEAGAVVDRLLELAPGDLNASFLKVTLAEARRDPDTARRTLEQLLERDRAHEEPEQTRRYDRIFLVHLGFAHQQLEQPGAAAEAFGRARELGDEPDPTLAAYQIEALRQGESYAEALDVAREARQAMPEDAGLLAAEATLLRESGDPEAGDALIEALFERSQSDPAALLAVADYYQQARLYGRAERALRAVRELGEEDLRTLYQLGAVLERQQRHDEAEEVFRAALELDPESAPVLNYLGYMNANRGVRLEDALALIERALTIDPENGAYLDSLGWALFRLDRLEQAEQRLREAVAREGGNAVVLDHLGDILDRRGERREAVEYWRKALAGEDEEDELDREQVERKIREALAILGEQTVAEEPR